jgi:hypothetical protein
VKSPIEINSTATAQLNRIRERTPRRVSPLHSSPDWVEHDVFTGRCSPSFMWLLCWVGGRKEDVKMRKLGVGRNIDQVEQENARYGWVTTPSIDHAWTGTAGLHGSNGGVVADASHERNTVRCIFRGDHKALLVTPLGVEVVTVDLARRWTRPGFSRAIGWCSSTRGAWFIITFFIGRTRLTPPGSAKFSASRTTSTHALKPARSNITVGLRLE